MRLLQGLFKIFIILLCLMLVLSFIRVSLNNGQASPMSFADVVATFQNYDFDYGHFFTIFDNDYNERLNKFYNKLATYSLVYSEQKTVVAKIFAILASLYDFFANFVDVYIGFGLCIAELGLFIERALLSIIVLIGQLFSLFIDVG